MFYPKVQIDILSTEKIGSCTFKEFVAIADSNLSSKLSMENYDVAFNM